MLAGSKDAARCLGCLTKYLTKHVGDRHQAATSDQHAGGSAMRSVTNSAPQKVRSMREEVWVPVGAAAVGSGRSMMLRECRALGLTRTGQPMAGLPGDFAIRPGDIPQQLADEGLVYTITAKGTLVSAKP